MGIHSFESRRTASPTSSRRTGGTPRVRGALALAQERAWPVEVASGSPARVGTPAESVAPGGVRALPVAIPRRRRPLHPTRGRRARVAPAVAPVEARTVSAPATASRPTTAPAPAPVRRRVARLAVLGRRLRFALLSLAVLAAAMIGALAGMLTAPSLASSTDVPSGTVTVAAGETLWEVASAHTPAEADVRETVERIAVANALVDGQVRAGQVLEVPVAD